MTVKERLSAKLAGMIVGAIERGVQGDDVDWDVSTGTAMTAQGPQTVANIFLWIPSAVLGQPAIGVTMGFPNPTVAEQSNIDALILQGLEALRNERTKQLTQAQAQVSP